VRRDSERLWLVVIAVAIVMGAVAGKAAQPASPKAEIEEFNRKYIDAHLRMDTPAIFAFWAEDGVSLLPDMAPLVGKPAIVKFVTDVIAKMPGYKVTQQTIDFQDIQISGDWASEWGMERQVVQAPDGKAPIDSRGKIMLILHREPDGRWLVKQEMWNSAPKP
jgi:uncharacterized protein (TIGR02246 family)